MRLFSTGVFLSLLFSMISRALKRLEFMVFVMDCLIILFPAQNNIFCFGIKNFKGDSFTEMLTKEKNILRGQFHIWILNT